MRVVYHCGERPGPDWHRHGTTDKFLWVIVGFRLRRWLLRKQRWRHRITGKTRHDRPWYDVPRHRYGFDVALVVLAAWLLTDAGLHAVDWPWSDDRPATRTVQRWAAELAPHAGTWLQASRQRLVDYVAPRPLEDLLPAGGIPPPRGARSRSSQGDAVQARQLRDVVWLHENVARALCIPLRLLLGVARWRWPKNTAIRDAS